MDWTKSPIYLGLPGKYKQWRPGQLSAVKDILANTGVIPRNLPTGSGKSLIYMAAAKQLGGRAVILTATKALQKQLMEDFGKIGLVSIQGKGNYPCPKGNWQTGEDSLCSLLTCDMQFSCPYYLALRIAKRANLVVTNYAYFLSQRELGEWDMIVMDEAHLLPQALESSLTTQVNYPFVAEVLGLPETPPPSDRWESWTENVYALLSQTIVAAVNARDESMVMRLLPVRRMMDKLPTILGGRHVIQDLGHSRFRFQAVLPSGAYLADLAERLTLVSATLTDKVLEQCELEGKTVYTPSQFPPAQQPVYVSPVAKVSRSLSTYDQIKLVRAMDSIIGARPDRKGIIHVSSYKWAEDIVGMSRFSDIIWPHSPQQINQVVEAFRRADPPAVMISPSLSTGYDFPLDDCNYQIIAKVQFPDLGDPVIQAKKEVDQEYYYNQAAQTLVQACGRGMRSDSDYCETIILDAHFLWLVKQYKHLFPKWFLKCLVFQKELPAPLPKCYFPYAVREA